MTWNYWLKKNYPIDAEISVPDTRTPGSTSPLSATVLSHTKDTIQGTSGIIVQDEDGWQFEIETAYLDENGGGI